MIVAYPSHSLAGRRNILLGDTLDYPWIASPKETPAGQYLFETLGIERLKKNTSALCPINGRIVRDFSSGSIYFRCFTSSG